jgi:hypothetical protein
MLRIVTGARILGLLVVVAAAFAANWMLTSSVFKLDQAQVSGEVRYTDVQAVLAAAGIGAADHPNVALLHGDEMRRKMLTFPAIADAQVDVQLPNHVSVTLTERQPVFALRRGTSLILVGADGLVLATADDPTLAALGVPVIEDDRTNPPVPIAVSGSIDPIELAAMLELGGLTPAAIDSAAASLALSVRDDDGFVLSAQPTGWQAIFGNYTPNLRPTDIIPRQVQCLRSLLGAGEAEVTTIYLAPLDERCGTYVPVATPRETPTPAPAR